MVWVQALGWAGSALLVFSLLQARVLRFRVLNLIACAILVALQRDPADLADGRDERGARGINLWFIRRLLAERSDENAYEVLEVAADDTYLRHFLKMHD